MYGIFTYIYHKSKPNAGKCTIHGSYGLYMYFEKRLEDVNVTLICGTSALQQKRRRFNQNKCRQRVSDSVSVCVPCAYSG